MYKSKPLYLHNPEFSTPEVQEFLDSFLPAWLDKHKLGEGARLYHYTALSGMRGIINERSLWLGHISSFNDPNEIQYGRKIITKVLDDIIEQENSQDVRTFLTSLSLYVLVFNKILHHPFVGCFCESDKSLSQWRVYADRGGGYCLGFHFSSTTRIASNLEKLGEQRFPLLRKVIYKEQEQRELVNQYLKGIIASAKKALSNPEITDKTYHADVMAVQAANVLLDMLICFKHPAFEEENEWRLIYVTSESHEPENLRFREANGYLIPYRPTFIFDESELKIFQFPIKSITFGPSLDPDRIRSAIQLLLHHIGIDGHQIKLHPTDIAINQVGYSLR